MDFYSQIADFYTYIFPLSQGQLHFILSRSNNCNQMKLLEVGCGIGELSMELSRHFFDVAGIDLDENMIKKANLNSKKHYPGLSFYHLNMLHLDQEFTSHHFDRIVSFGNTLVHLLEDDQIVIFFKQSREALRNQGRLMFQILNYDYILDHHVTQLPVIENDIIRFERTYDFLEEKDFIHFNTSLIIKESGTSLSNTIPLNPIRKNKIEDLLKEAGYASYQFFGSYHQDPYKNDSEILLCEAIK